MRLNPEHEIDAAFKAARRKVDYNLFRRVAKMDGGVLRFFKPMLYVNALMDADSECLHNVAAFLAHGVGQIKGTAELIEALNEARNAQTNATVH